MNDNDQPSIVSELDDVTIPNTPTEGITPERLKDIKRKKLIFGTFIKFFGLGVAALITLIIFVVVINKIRENNRKILVKNDAQEVAIDKRDETVTSMNLYSNDGLKITFKYPADAVVVEPSGFDTTNNYLEVHKLINPKTDMLSSDQDLIEGYIIRVTPLILEKRTLTTVAETKKQSMIAKCVSTATISEIIDTTINNKPAKTFDVINCEPNYTINFVEHEGKFYEITQIYNGDVGIIQKYRGITNELLTSLSFIKTIFTEEELSPYFTYEVKGFNYGIKFKYSKTADTTCCFASIPPASVTPLLSVYITENNNKIGGYTLFNAELSKMNFDSFVSNQKTLLKDDYLVVTGKPAEISEENIEVGVLPYYGLYLYGYTWQKNTLLYIKQPIEKRVFIVSIENKDNEKVAQELKVFLDTLDLSAK